MDQNRIDEQTEFRLTQYLDGELSADDARELEQQIQASPALQEQLRLYRSLDRELEAVAAASRPDIDEEFQRSSIMASLERKALLMDRPRRGLVIKLTFGAAAAIAAMLLVALGVRMLYPLAQVGGPGGGSVAISDLTHPTPKPAAVIDVAVIEVKSAKPSKGQGIIVAEMDRKSMTELPTDLGGEEESTPSFSGPLVAAGTGAADNSQDDTSTASAFASPMP